MPTIQVSRQCRQCGRQTLHSKEKFGFTAGCLLTILTAGLFIPFWLIADVFGFLKKYRCQICGTARR